VQYFGRSAWPHWGDGGGASPADMCVSLEPDGVRERGYIFSDSLPIRRPSALVVLVAVRLRHRRRSRRQRCHRPPALRVLTSFCRSSISPVRLKSVTTSPAGNLPISK